MVKDGDSIRVVVKAKVRVRILKIPWTPKPNMNATAASSSSLAALFATSSELALGKGDNGGVPVASAVCVRR